jgi:transcriptional regulator of heat shock response
MQQRVSIRIGSQDPDELDRRVSVIVFSFYITGGGAQTTGVIDPLQLNTILNGQSLQILLRHE